MLKERRIWAERSSVERRFQVYHFRMGFNHTCISIQFDAVYGIGSLATERESMKSKSNNNFYISARLFSGFLRIEIENAKR